MALLPLPTRCYVSVPTGQIARALSSHHSCSDDDGCYAWTAPYNNKSANILLKIRFSSEHWDAYSYS